MTHYKKHSLRVSIYDLNYERRDSLNIIPWPAQSEITCFAYKLDVFSEYYFRFVREKRLVLMGITHKRESIRFVPVAMLDCTNMASRPSRIRPKGGATGQIMRAQTKTGSVLNNLQCFRSR